MRVALINASLRDSRAYSLPDGFPRGFGGVIRPYQPLGLLSVASALLRAGFEDILLIDADAERLSREEIVRRVNAYSPDIIGLSCMTFTFLYCLGLARDLKNETDSIIVIGGTHPGLYPKEVLSHSSFDIAVLCDGERPFCEIVQRLSASRSREEFFRSLRSVGGIAFRSGGAVLQTPSPPVLTDIDKLPFPTYHLVDIRRYNQDYLRNPSATVITSRGCSLRCSFCSRSPWDRGDRYHSPAYVVNMLEHVIDTTGARSFYIVDDTFTYHRRRAIKICEMIQERGLDIQFSALTRVTHIDREVATAMKRAGLRCLSFGVESGNQEILNKLRKGQTVQQIRDAFNVCRQAGIDTIAYFLVGHPDEERAHIENTIRLIREIRPGWLKANILVPYPGTSLYDSLITSGGLPDFWREMTLTGAAPPAPHIARHLSPRELRHFQRRIDLLPYTRLKDNNFTKLRKVRNLSNAALSARWIFQCGLEMLRDVVGVR